MKTKVEQEVFERKIDNMEEDNEKSVKKFVHDLSALRDMADRLRIKNEDLSHSVHELNAEIDGKLARKEGQKLWANFRKYA